MKNSKQLLPFVLVIIFFAVGFFLISHSSKILKPEDIKYVKIAGVNIKVDLALSTIEQEKGLGGRSGLNENEGMLFVFPASGKYDFWMKGMNFPIDIIWLTEDRKVIYIKKNAQPEALLSGAGDAGLQTFGPDDNAKYVLEVVSGFSDKNNLQVGDTALFTY